MNIPAFLDTFSGLVPCMVIAATPSVDCVGRATTEFTIRLTATRGAYKCGEVLTRESRDSVVPRFAVHYRCGIARIWAYDWRVILSASKHDKTGRPLDPTVAYGAA